MIEGTQPFHPRPAEEAVKLMCLERKRPQFKIKTKSYPPDLKELVKFKLKIRPSSFNLFKICLIIMVHAGWLRNVRIQNLLSGQHFHRSLYDWTKLLQISQSKDGGKILLNFLGMFPRLIISLSKTLISLEEFKVVEFSSIPWNTSKLCEVGICAGNK